MGKTKASSGKKQKQPQKRGVDFKKIKRKIGRKLPPPKNATNTDIKSKAIVLPEQSVASDKAGFAVNKKGLTLKELLQQTSHHNAKVRKDALLGMKDLFLTHPQELKLHKYAVMEKLRERVGDEDKVVRETLYQLLKSVVLPGCKEGNQGPLVSLMIAYIFNAMTHLAIDVRLMAFKFFDLFLQFYPPSFSLYGEKILQNFEIILRKNQFYLEDKGKLKNVLAGLVNCLSLLPSNKRDTEPSEKNVPGQEILHGFEPDIPGQEVSSEFSAISKKVGDLVPVLVNCFHDFSPSISGAQQLDAQSFDCMLSILQSIDLAVRFIAKEIHKDTLDLQPLCGQYHMTLWDQNILSMSCKKLLDVFPFNPVHRLSEKDDDRYFILNIVIAEIFLHLSERIYPTADLLEKFLAFIEDTLLGQMCSGRCSGKAIREKKILGLISFIPKLVSRVIGNWKSRLLQALTEAFQGCRPESSLKVACLTAIEEILISRGDVLYPDEFDPEILDHLITWMKELPRLLVLLGSGHPSSSKIALHLLLCLGQCCSTSSSLALEYDNLQHSLVEFYSTCQDEAGSICYGPFIKLARDSQELSVCCLYYFSYMDPVLLKSIASCCLCHELDSFVLFRIIEVLNSAYKAGHIQLADHISFFVTLVSHFKVVPEKIHCAAERDASTSNHDTFRAVTSVVSSSLSQIGDNSLVLLIIERVILEQMSLKPPLDNACAMLRLLVVLDSKPTRLSEQSIINLSDFLSVYLIDIIQGVPEDDDEQTGSTYIQTRRYYFLPCFFLFERSHKLLRRVLTLMGSSVTESSLSLVSGGHPHHARGQSQRIDAIVSVLLSMCRDPKVRQLISLSRAEIALISENIRSLKTSETSIQMIEEKRRIQCAVDQLQILTSSLDQDIQMTQKN